jgi:hypothetical protein
MPAGSNRTDHDAVLKEFYLPGVRTVLNNEIFLLTQVEANTEDIEGREAVLNINTGRNQGIGSRQELADLPAAGRQAYANQRVKLKYHYGRIQLSGQIIRDTSSDSGSFTRAVQSETTGVVRDLKNDIARQVYGDGTGVIGLASGAKTGQTFPMANMSAQVIAQLGIGMAIDIGSDAANPADIASGVVITSINRATKVITVSGTLGTIANGSRISRAGSGGTGVTQSELTGLKAQVAASGALWGVDPADHPDWASYVKTSAGAVSEDMFIECDQEVNMASGETINLWVTTSAVHRGVAKLLQADKRFPGTNELRGGYSGLDMSSVSQGMTGSNTVSMVFDKDMTETGCAYGLATNRWACYSGSDWEFMQEDGAVLNRVPGKDAYEATLFAYKEIATDGRNANAKISGITVS